MWEIAHQHLLLAKLRVKLALQIDIIELAASWSGRVQIERFSCCVSTCSNLLLIDLVLASLGRRLPFTLEFVPILFNRVTLVLFHRSHTLDFLLTYTQAFNRIVDEERPPELISFNFIKLTASFP